MVFKRVGDVVEEGAGFLEARARILIHRLERAGIVAAGYTAAGIVVVAGVLTLLAALTVWVAQELGTAPALAITGGLLLATALMTVLALKAWRHKPSEQEQALLVEAAAAKEAFRKAIRGPEEEQDRRPGLFDQWGGASGILQMVMKNPAMLAGGLAVATSLFAGSKVIRLLSRIVAVTGMASTLAATIRQVREAVDTARTSAGAQCNGEATMHREGHSRGAREVRL